MTTYVNKIPAGHQLTPEESASLSSYVRGFCQQHHVTRSFFRRYVTACKRSQLYRRIAGDSPWDYASAKQALDAIAQFLETSANVMKDNIPPGHTYDVWRRARTFPSGHELKRNRAAFWTWYPWERTAEQLYAWIVERETAAGGVISYVQSLHPAFLPRAWTARWRRCLARRYSDDMGFEHTPRGARELGDLFDLLRSRVLLGPAQTGVRHTVVATDRWLREFLGGPGRYWMAFEFYPTDCCDAAQYLVDELILPGNVDFQVVSHEALCRTKPRNELKMPWFSFTTDGRACYYRSYGKTITCHEPTPGREFDPQLSDCLAAHEQLQAHLCHRPGPRGAADYVRSLIAEQRPSPQARLPRRAARQHQGRTEAPADAPTLPAAIARRVKNPTAAKNIANLLAATADPS
jgi:hypothetical protein